MKKRKFYITKQQLDEIINSELMISTNNYPDYDGSQVTTTEPKDNGTGGTPITGDEKSDGMAPGLFQRMTTGVYGGPTI